MIPVDLYSIEKHLTPRGFQALHVMLNECYCRQGDYVCSQYEVTKLIGSGLMDYQHLDELIQWGIVYMDTQSSFYVLKPSMVNPADLNAMQRWTEQLAWR